MAKTTSPWKTLSSKIAYETPYVRIREDQVIRPDGKPGIYSVIEHEPAVFVAALTEDEQIYLINLYRYPTSRMSLELPAGNTDGEDPITAAHRELQEETGLVAAKIEIIGQFQSYNGLASEISYSALATGLTQTGQNSKKEEGISSIQKYPLSKVIEMLGNGELSDGQSIAALTQVLLHLGKIKLC